MILICTKNRETLLQKIYNIGEVQPIIIELSRFHMCGQPKNTW